MDAARPMVSDSRNEFAIARSRYPNQHQLLPCRVLDPVQQPASPAQPNNATTPRDEEKTLMTNPLCDSLRSPLHEGEKSDQEATKTLGQPLKCSSLELLSYYSPTPPIKCPLSFQSFKANLFQQPILQNQSQHQLYFLNSKARKLGPFRIKPKDCSPKSRWSLTHRHPRAAYRGQIHFPHRHHNCSSGHLSPCRPSQTQPSLFLSTPESKLIIQNNRLPLKSTLAFSRCLLSSTIHKRSMQVDHSLRPLRKQIKRETQSFDTSPKEVGLTTRRVPNFSLLPDSFPQ